MSNTLTKEKIRDFLSQHHRLEILYNWVQNNEITLDNFKYLLDRHYQEEDYQKSLDTFD